MYKAYLAKPYDKVYQWAKIMKDCDDYNENIVRYAKDMFWGKMTVEIVLERGPFGAYWLYCLASVLNRTEYDEICRAHLLPPCYWIFK